MKIDKNKDMDVKYNVIKKDINKLIKAVIDSLVATDQVTIKFIENDVMVIKQEDGNILNTPYIGATLEINIKRNC